jgi:hypothetical protein
VLDTKLIDILPERISDEAAYHLINFISELAITLEDHYFVQLRRYNRDGGQADLR